MASKDKQTMKIKNLFTLVLFGLVLLFAQKDIPHFGESGPIHQKINTVYLDETYEKTHTKNIITAVLADWRGVDTLGETKVVFAAGLADLMILGAKKIT